MTETFRNFDSAISLLTYSTREWIPALNAAVKVIKERPPRSSGGQRQEVAGLASVDQALFDAMQAIDKRTDAACASILNCAGIGPSQFQEIYTRMYPSMSLAERVARYEVHKNYGIDFEKKYEKKYPGSTLKFKIQMYWAKNYGPEFESEYEKKYPNSTLEFKVQMHRAAQEAKNTARQRRQARKT